MKRAGGIAVFMPEPFPPLNKNQVGPEKSQVGGRQISDLLK